MKSQSIIKSPNGDRSSFLASLGPNIIQPGKGKRKILPQTDFSIDSIRNNVKSNQQTNENLTSLLTERGTLLEKIESLEGEILRNQDVIANTRQQLAIYAQCDQYYDDDSRSQMNDENQNLIAEEEEIIEEEEEEERAETTQKTENESNEEIKKLKPEKKIITVEYLHNKPLIMMPFLCQELNMDPFFEEFQNTDPDSINTLINTSIFQLNKLSHCNESFLKIKDFVESQLFVEVFQARTQKIFNSEVVNVFLFDPKSNEYTCNTKNGFMQIALFSGSSILGDILDSQKPEIIQKPLQHHSFSSRIDLPFNPNSEPFLAFPIFKYALIMIRRPNSTFFNEDCHLAHFHSNLMKPLFNCHIQHVLLKRQVEFRRILHYFETDLNEKTTFSTLLPYLLSSLNNFVGANDANLYLINKDSLFTFEIEEDKVVKKQYKRVGAPEWISRNKIEFETNNLNSETFKSYDEGIDGWSFEKSFAAFPIFSMKEVIAVLCVSDKIGCNKFNQWDIDLLRTICGTLSLVVPSCIKNEETVLESDQIAAARLFPKTIQSFTFNSMQEISAIEMIAKTIQNSLNCEWLSIYTLSDTSEEIQKLITLHNDSKVDTNFLDPVYIRMTLTKLRPFNVSDPTKLDGFKTIGDITTHAFLCAFNAHHKEKIGIYALNSKAGENQFSEIYPSIIQAIAGFIVFSFRIRILNQAISDGKSATMTMSNAFNICSSLFNDSDPFPKLLNVICELLSMECFSMIRYNSLKSEYETILQSEGCPKSHISCEDSLISHFNELKGSPLFINDFSTSDFSNSGIVDFFPHFKQLLVNPFDDTAEQVVIFAGKSAVSNYSLLFKYFMPLAKIFYKTFQLNLEVKIVESEELNKIDFYHSKFTDEVLESLSFDAHLYNNTQKDEAVLKMFANLNLIEALGTTVEQLAIFLLKVRQSYNDIPYHNYSHAVDVTQFTYILLLKIGDMLTSIQKASLMLAALLHDVCHEGFDSTYLKKSFSPFIYAYGDISTLEHHHVSAAVELLCSHLIFEQSGMYYDQLFWKILTSSILSTDINQAKNFILSLQTFADDFEEGKEENIILFSKLVLQIANIGNCYRPFDIARRSAEALMEEKHTAFEDAKACSIQIEEVVSLVDLEKNFIEEIAKPLLELMKKIVPSTDFLVDPLKFNLESWNNFTP